MMIQRDETNKQSPWRCYIKAAHLATWDSVYFSLLSIAVLSQHCDDGGGSNNQTQRIDQYVFVFLKRYQQWLINIYIYIYIYTYIYISGLWFQTCFIFHNIWDNLSHWLSYFSRWLKPPSIFKGCRPCRRPRKKKEVRSAIHNLRRSDGWMFVLDS